MRIILQRPVDKLGEPGDLVEVADGYARNYLVPRGFAQPATKGAVTHAQRLRERRDERSRRALGEAEALAARLTATRVRLASQAGEDGKLFGSITAPQVAEELSRAVGQDIDRRKVHLVDPIRSLGAHEVRVHVHPEVNATVTVEVVAAAK
ncbi:MAG: 50S ribosomal protein L9 [Actinomycetota bacterium]|nr:50S ribosomal protein L9 [Actinomycetota bacterium]